ncbi:hypothetical protein HYU11_04080 [Candidatus Woesearchaeota archaeon]|nr:hypothetical protein [Candidatus Woesearchaeota archaeon]
MVRQLYVKQAIRLLERAHPDLLTNRQPDTELKKVQEAWLILQEALSEDWCNECNK